MIEMLDRHEKTQKIWKYKAIFYKSNNFIHYYQFSSNSMVEIDYYLVCKVIDINRYHFYQSLSPLLNVSSLPITINYNLYLYSRY